MSARVGVKSIFVPVVICGLTIALFIWVAFKERPLISTITSPNGELSLRLTGDPTRPMTPLLDHSVYFDLSRNKEAVLVGKQLHTGDWFDASFDDLYIQHRWVSNSVIQFMREFVPDDKCDKLVVRNDTDKSIAYLQLESRDKFLLFDLKPRSELTLYANPQAWLSWIEVEGQFTDNQPIPWKGVNFSVERSVGPFDYVISINSNGAQIGSRQLPEYRGSP